jgi:nicotinamide-nucleotide amidase
MWFEKDGRIYVSMPGVPHEMKGMVLESVLPALRKHFTLPHIAHRTLLTAGIGESFLADHIKSFEEALPPSLKLAYLPNYGMVRLRLTVRGEEAGQTESVLQEQFGRLKELVSEWMVADEDLTLEEVVGRLLAERGKTLGLAESCTGGFIAHLITSIPGSSQYFRGGVVSYANEIKEEVLHVDRATILSVGAVSEETVKQMVQGALDVLGCDYVIATSGIMGPEGGTPEKPVGTVWMAAGTREHVVTQKSWFRFDRRRNIELTSTNALNLLRKIILD